MSTVQIPAHDLEPPRQQAASVQVSAGSTVSFTDQRAGRDQTFTIVAPHEAKPQDGTLSIASPVASALLNHKVGDLVEVHTPSGRRPLLITSVA